jgi:hypothetical protein
MSQGLLRFHPVSVWQSEPREEKLNEEVQPSEAGNSAILSEGLGSKTRSNSAVVCFPLSSVPLQSVGEAVISCWCL